MYVSMHILILVLVPGDPLCSYRWNVN